MCLYILFRFNFNPPFRYKQRCCCCLKHTFKVLHQQAFTFPVASAEEHPRCWLGFWKTGCFISAVVVTLFLMHDFYYWKIKSHLPCECCEVMSCSLFLLVLCCAPSRGLCSQLPLSLGGSTSSSMWLTLTVSDSETNKSQKWELIGWVLLSLHESRYAVPGGRIRVTSTLVKWRVKNESEKK